MKKIEEAENKRTLDLSFSFKVENVDKLVETMIFSYAYEYFPELLEVDSRDDI